MTKNEEERMKELRKAGKDIQKIIEKFESTGDIGMNEAESAGLLTSDELKRRWSSENLDNAKLSRERDQEERDFGRNLEGAMGKYRLSPNELDIEMNLPSGTTNLYISGQLRPTKETVRQYAKIMNVQPEVLWPEPQS
jgi:hypothetical protein